MLSLPFRGESAIIKGQTTPICGVLVFCIALRVLVTPLGAYDCSGAGNTGAVFVLAVVGCGAKVGSPLFDDFVTPGFDDHHDIAQRPVRDAGVVVAQTAVSGGGDPNLRGVAGWCALRDVDMNRLKGIAFV